MCLMLCVQAGFCQIRSHIWFCSPQACNNNLIQKHPECKKRSNQKTLKKAGMKRTEIEMGGQGRCSISADENKI